MPPAVEFNKKNVKGVFVAEIYCFKKLIFYILVFYL